MAINDPRDIPGLVAWFSAEAETGYTDGAGMTGWTDLSGNGNHATLTGTGQPVWQATTGPAGGPSVRWGNASFNLPNCMSGAASGEVLAYHKADSATGNNRFWNLGGAGLLNRYPNSSGVVLDDFGANGQYSFTPTLSLTSWRRYAAWASLGD